LDDGSEDTKYPQYSEELFCEGFNLTALDFYIVRRRLMSLLYRDSLYLKKRKGGKFLDAEYEYREVEEKISKHSLLSSLKVGALWKGKMIADFITKTAEFMRAKFPVTVHADEDVVPGQPMFKLSHILIEPRWNWGPAVMALEYDRQEHTPLSRLNIVIRSYPPDPEDQGATIRVSSILLASTGKSPIDSASYDKFRVASLRIFTKATGREALYLAAYQNPYWGNEIILVDDDKSLRIAIKTLRVRGKATLPFWVSTRSSRFVLLVVLTIPVS
jgi:hypothetical protein